jgi:hypothetical protein
LSTICDRGGCPCLFAVYYSVENELTLENNSDFCINILPFMRGNKKVDFLDFSYAYAKIIGNKKFKNRFSLIL